MLPDFSGVAGSPNADTGLGSLLANAEELFWGVFGGSDEVELESGAMGAGELPLIASPGVLGAGLPNDVVPADAKAAKPPVLGGVETEAGDGLLNGEAGLAAPENDGEPKADCPKPDCPKLEAPKAGFAPKLD